VHHHAQLFLSRWEPAELCLGCARTVILPISASYGARMIDVSHWHLAPSGFFKAVQGMKEFLNSCKRPGSPCYSSFSFLLLISHFMMSSLKPVISFLTINFFVMMGWILPKLVLLD
jgi:hypothetical protein